MLLRLRLAASFLTVVPVPVPRAPTDRDLAGSMAFYPLVGAAVGAALAGIALAGGPGIGGLPWPVVGALVVGAELLVTAGLHVDGLSDFADALGASGRGPERRLEVMRDPAAGPMGVAALGVYLALKVAALPALLQAHGAAALVALAVVPRLSFPWVARLFPYARPQGKGGFSRELRTWDVGAATALGAALVGASLGARGLAALVPALVVALLVGAVARRVVGGVTGDVMGAAGCVAELTFLVAVLVRAGG